MQYVNKKHNFLIYSKKVDLINYISSLKVKYVVAQNSKEFINLATNLSFSAIILDELTVQENIKSLLAKNNANQSLIVLFSDNPKTVHSSVKQQFRIGIDYTFDLSLNSEHLLFFIESHHNQKKSLVVSLNQIKKIKHDIANALTGILGKIIKIKKMNIITADAFYLIDDFEKDTKKINSNIQLLAELPEQISKEYL